MRTALQLLTALTLAACAQPGEPFNVPAEVVRADAETM